MSAGYYITVGVGAIIVFLGLVGLFYLIDRWEDRRINERSREL